MQRADAVSFNNCRLEPDRIGSPHFVQVRDDVNDFTLTNSQILGTGTKTVISVSATSTGTLIEGNEITAIGDEAISAIEVLGGLDAHRSRQQVPQRCGRRACCQWDSRRS